VEAAAHTLKASGGKVTIDKVQCRCAYSEGAAAASAARARDVDRQSRAPHDMRREDGEARSPSPRREVRWPPVFTSAAGRAAFHFDRPSGYFFEPASQFYYDAKTKRARVRKTGT